MRKENGEKRRKGRVNTIGKRIFRMLLAVVFILSVFFTALNIIFVVRYSERAEMLRNDMLVHVTTEIIDPLSEEKDQSILNLTSGNAKAINRFLLGCQNTTEMISSVAERLYREDQPVEQGVVPLAAKDLEEPRNIYRLEAPGFDASDPGSKHTLEVMSRIRHTLRSVLAMDTDVNSVYFASTEGFTLFADENLELALDEEGKALPFDAKTRDWYQNAAEKGQAVCSSLKKDYFTGKGVITISVPVYGDEAHTELIGVAAVDVTLNTVEEIMGNSMTNIVGVCLINEKGEIQISTETEGLFGLKPDETKSLYSDKRPEMNEALDEAVAGKSGFRPLVLNADDSDLFLGLDRATMTMEEYAERTKNPDQIKAYTLYYSSIPLLGWSYLYAADTAHLTEKVDTIMNEFFEQLDEQEASDLATRSRTFLILILIFSGIILAMYAISAKISKRVTGPLVALTEKVQAVNGDNLDFSWDMKADLETQTLAESFEAMTEKIREYIRDLTAVTAEKERIGAELDVARKIQADMLPMDFPNRTTLKLFASMTPAKEVGGDFYDFFPVGENHIALVIADVSGKGVPAALFMVIAKTLIKHRAMAAISGPKGIFEAANQILCERNEEMLFVTAWIGILNISTGEMICANAGHEYPMIRRAGKNFKLFTDQHDIPLAAVEGVEFQEYSLRLNPGDSLFVYTDGFPESMNEENEQFTEKRMLAALNESPGDDPRVLDERLRLRVSEFVGEASQFDDMTALGIKYYGPEEEG